MQNHPSYMHFPQSSRVLLLRGAESLDLLQRITTSDLKSVADGRAVATLLTTEKGRVIDILVVSQGESPSTLIVGCGDGSSQAAKEAVERYIIMEDVTVSDVSDSHMVAISFSVEDDCWIPADIRASNSFMSESSVVPLWKHRISWNVILLNEKETVTQFAAGNGWHLLSDQDFLRKRVLHGVPWCGAELSTKANPLEARARSLVSFTKGCYVGQEVVARLDTYRKAQRVLTRLEVAIGAGPLEGEILHAPGGEEAGSITSWCPWTGTKVNALGLVRTPFLQSGITLTTSGGLSVNCVDTESESGIYKE